MTRAKYIMVSGLAWVAYLAIGTMPVSAEPASKTEAQVAFIESEFNSIELAALGEQPPFVEFEQSAPLRADNEVWNELRLRGDERGFSVAVSHKFSTWSDLTSVFRPSRWKNPVRPGGPLSFVNLECWITDPGRTAKTFIGTAVVAGGIAAITSGSGGGQSSKEAVASAPAETTAASQPATSRTDEPTVESAPVESTSVSAPAPAAPAAVEPPAPEPPSGGFVEES